MFVPSGPGRNHGGGTGDELRALLELKRASVVQEFLVVLPADVDPEEAERCIDVRPGDVTELARANLRRVNEVLLPVDVDPNLERGRFERDGLHVCGVLVGKGGRCSACVSVALRPCHGHGIPAAPQVSSVSTNRSCESGGLVRPPPGAHAQSTMGSIFMCSMIS